MLEEICKGTFEHSYLGIRSIKRTLQIKRSRLKEKKKHWSIHLNPKTKRISPARNRTPVSRVTGGDTHHCTTEEPNVLDSGIMGYGMGKHPISR